MRLFLIGLILLIAVSQAGAAPRLNVGLSYLFTCDGSTSIGDFTSVPVAVRIRQVQIVAPPGVRVTFYAGAGSDVKSRLKKAIVAFRDIDFGLDWVALNPGDLVAVEATCTAPPAQIEVRVALSYETGP